MFLQIDDAIRRTGERFETNLSESFDRQKFNGRWVEFAEPVTLDCSYSYDGKVLTVEGTVRTVLNSRCARCDKPFEEPLTVPFSEKFFNAKYTSEMTDDDLYSFTGNAADLTEAVLSALFLSLPIVSLCRADCKGLCPICGCDRNVEECSCETDMDQVLS